MSENDTNKTIAVVAHGGIINQLFHSFLRLPVDSDLFFQTNDACFHEWQVNESSKTIVKTNFSVLENNKI